MAFSSCIMNLVFSCVLLVVLVHCEETDHLEDRDLNIDEPQPAERFSGEAGPEKRQWLDSVNSIASTSLEKRIENELTDADRRELFNSLKSLKSDAETLRKRRGWLDLAVQVVSAIAGKRAEKTSDRS